DDAAGGPRVGVEADAEQQAAGAGLLNVDQDVLVRAIAVRIDNCDGRPDTELRVILEQVQPGQGLLALAESWVREWLSRKQRYGPQDDILLRRRVAVDNDLTGEGRRPFLDLVVHSALAGPGEEYPVLD